MGYITFVTSEILIRKSQLERVRKEIAEAHKAISSGKNSYIHYHMTECTMEERDGDTFLIPYDDGCKWYEMDEFLSWIKTFVQSGYFEWSGEEQGDTGFIEWKDGKVFEEVKTMKETGTYEQDKEDSNN